MPIVFTFPIAVTTMVPALLVALNAWPTCSLWITPTVTIVAFAPCPLVMDRAKSAACMAGAGISRCAV
jgi:hypothetical protein